jgi:hypothetical protein
MDAIPPEALLDSVPPPIRALAGDLRLVVHGAVPEAIERVRPGWRLIGYDVPNGRRTSYFAFVAPEPGHVHLGFEYGWLMDDSDGLLLGRNVTKRVRWLTFRSGDRVDDRILAPLVVQAAQIALGSREERFLRAMEHDGRGDARVGAVRDG